MTNWTFFASKIIVLRMHISTLRVAYSKNIPQSQLCQFFTLFSKENGKIHFGPIIDVLL